MEKKKVAIQGIKGSYHHQAARMFFGEEVDLVQCENFKEIPQHITNGTAQYGVMAIENSIAGSLLQNYKLLGQKGQCIQGEIYIPIEHSLLVNKGQTIEDLKEVHSHPMAILQSEQFFEQYPHIKLVEETDTASSAKKVADKNLKDVGAIAGEIAGEIYGLEAIKTNIQTIKNNYTRFFIIGTHKHNYTANPEINKASMRIVLSHEKGSLAKVLSIFSIHGMNLTKIQSMPIMEKPWQYNFFVDLEFPTYDTFKSVMEIMKHQAEKVEVLGVYKEWKMEHINRDAMRSEEIKK
ncbi:MAG: prephenate dehydratase [Ichthyobacteriaceae bacterium]|nr:prephenate dehydratase [Ichthyobacteriaceae bacterium]